MRRLLPLLLSFPLSASTLSTSTSASVGQFPFLAIGGQTGTTKSSVSLTGSYGEVDAQAAATYGSVRVNSFAETDGTKATALADTSFTDTIQLFGTGTATFTAQVNGYANRPDSGSPKQESRCSPRSPSANSPIPAPPSLPAK